MKQCHSRSVNKPGYSETIGKIRCEKFISFFFTYVSSFTNIDQPFIFKIFIQSMECIVNVKTFQLSFHFKKFHNIQIPLNKQHKSKKSYKSK